MISQPDGVVKVTPIVDALRDAHGDEGATEDASKAIVVPASWFFDPADKTALVVDYKIDAKGASIALLLRVSAGGVLKTRVDLLIGAGDPSRDRGFHRTKRCPTRSAPSSWPDHGGEGGDRITSCIFD